MNMAGSAAASPASRMEMQSLRLSLSAIISSLPDMAMVAVVVVAVAVASPTSPLPLWLSLPDCKI